MSTEKYNKEQIRNRMTEIRCGFLGNKKGGKLRPGCQAPAGSIVQRDIYAGRGFYRHRDKAAGKDRPNPYSRHPYLTLSRTRHRTRYPIEPCYLITGNRACITRATRLPGSYRPEVYRFIPPAIPCCTKPT